jgi:uncharacterized protein (UPF0332 family)
MRQSIKRYYYLKGNRMKENVFDTEIIRRLYKHRWAMNYGDTAKKETVEFWNERAKDFAVKAYSEKARAETNRFHFGDVEDPWNIQCSKPPYGCE